MRKNKKLEYTQQYFTLNIVNRHIISISVVLIIFLVMSTENGTNRLVSISLMK